MRCLLVGVSCVGKTTIGRLLARRLGCPFFDLDEEIERHFGTSVERLRARFLTSYSYSKEVSIVLKRIVTEKDDCVIALVPSGLRDAYLRIIRKTDCVTIALQDTPNNILRRITFYDIDSRRIVKELTEAEKALYRKEIKEDVTFFSKSYERADLRVDISGLGAECSAEMIAGLLARRISGRT